MMPILRQVGTNHYRIPGDVPIDVFANEPILRTFDDAVFQQAGNTASVPGVESVVLMPDAHSGYGAPIGAVVATKNTLIPTGEGRRGIQPMPAPASGGSRRWGASAAEITLLRSRPSPWNSPSLRNRLVCETGSG